MAEINKEARASFYKELAHRLTAEGYAVEPEADDPRAVGGLLR